MAQHQLVRDAKTQEDRGSGIEDSEHQGVADRLHLGPTARWQLRPHSGAEVGHDRCRLVVAVCLRQRGEARDVGEYERGAYRRLYGVHRHEIRDRLSTDPPSQWRKQPDGTRAAPPRPRSGVLADQRRTRGLATSRGMAGGATADFGAVVGAPAAHE
jgi:hypothetical protein